ncbi:hypothetical protein NPIL_60411 [Nephila pilipes]|uniref:Uncharacterized protein n=1 Tax=Nephila pilipes TaxID=299642 RepID=A0A8X6PT28_NEPPI|nr:hypothetical protein NPIL_60411 [Nephila pilipes]
MMQNMFSLKSFPKLSVYTHTIENLPSPTSISPTEANRAPSVHYISDKCKTVYQYQFLLCLLAHRSYLPRKSTPTNQNISTDATYRKSKTQLKQSQK